MLVILFGLAGSGKNYVGNVIADNFKFHFWDADKALTPKMHECIKNKISFTQTMRDEFCDIIINSTKELLSQHPHVVVAQALYKETNRKQISNAFPDAIFIHVSASNQLICKRLIKRGDQITPDYAATIALNFEMPTIKHLMLLNNSDQSLIVQQMSLFITHLQILPTYDTTLNELFSSKAYKSIRSNIFKFFDSKTLKSISCVNKICNEDQREIELNRLNMKN